MAPPDGKEKQKRKEHRVHSKGGKVTKKKDREKKDGTSKVAPPEVNRARKGYTFKSANKANRAVRRAADIDEKKKHIPYVDRTSTLPPPIIVAIVGPSKVGKTTLLRGLIKNYVRGALSQIKGPVTIVTNKTRRVTFIEVKNDINHMIDVAKIADLVLLMVDASYGFEMEHFEFLNICQIHGMPRVLGILNHLDCVPKLAKQRKIKKQLKHRFWTEVYQGCKMFYLSKITNEKYLTNDVKNLARFISVMKFRPMPWRDAHPYILCDRFEDITDPEVIKKNDKTDRAICLYGYMRGAQLKEHSAVHVPGIGDLRVASITSLADPCPFPDKTKRRGLNEKEKIIYAPFSGLGGIVYDKDAIYIDTKGAQSFSKNRKRNELVEALENVKVGIDDKMQNVELRLLANSKKAVTNVEDGDVEMDDEEDNDDYSLIDEDEEFDGMSEEDFKSEDDEENESGSDEDDGEELFKKRPTTDQTLVNAINAPDLNLSDVANRAAQLYTPSKTTRINWNKIVYDEDNATKEETQENDELTAGLFTIKRKDKAKTLYSQEDGFCYRQFPSTSTATINNWEDSEQRATISDCFVTGKWDEEAAEKKKLKDELRGAKHGDDDDDDDVWDAFDLDEEGNPLNDDDEDMNESDEDHNDEEEEVDGEAKEDEDSEGKNEDKSENKKDKKKMRLRHLFDPDHDESNEYFNNLKAELEDQAKLNRNAFEGLEDQDREKIEGFRAGVYVRIEFSGIPYEMVEHFDATSPYIIGGLLTGEQNIGVVQVRLKRHRWFDRILKSRDPLIISCGWRRYQTLVIYSMQDHNMRQRFLKYSPEHMHCHATFWGPITSQNTGFLAVQSVADRIKGFRICASGVVLNLDRNHQVVKKLKLIGTPHEIHKKTAFMKGMFTSQIEAAKFEGATIRTVSGIRGEIKKAIPRPPGNVRCTFEDKILMSDIVFLRTWVTVPIPQFYTSVIDHLMTPENKWEGMRTVGKIRHELGLKPETKKDSDYREVERVEFRAPTLKVPKKLEAELPYRLKPKHGPMETKPTKEQSFIAKHTAVILEPEDSKRERLMNMLRTLHKESETKDKVARDAAKEKHRKEVEEFETKRARNIKLHKKAICRRLSKQEQSKKSN
ncbi:unnamed protein product, partial [Mesorhabditis belari]|uniref:Bms1-type G domain-containing protein n=1 Tax=Mesorhabditis belari TaxID=2138241 RepID=A0AAF3ESL5_9BILA